MSKIKAIIFDLDGVLVSTKKLHFHAFNDGLGDLHLPVLTFQDHLSHYDGLSTKQKIALYKKKTGLEFDSQKLYDKKQEYTETLLPIFIKKDDTVINLIRLLDKGGYKCGIASNTIEKSLNCILSLLGGNIRDCLHSVISNNNIDNPKPHPEIYWRSMIHLDALPEETLIIEDSPTGIQAAQRSGANVMIVKGPEEVTYDNILRRIKEIQDGEVYGNIFESKELNVLIPMAGAGSRFEKAGYSFPKPLIAVQNFNGKPMIQVVVESLKIKANYIYIVQREHNKKYNLETILNIITPGCKIYQIDGMTDGAARTIMAAENSIDNDNPLFICNSDQFLDWNPNDFFYKMHNRGADGGIVTFENTHPKWSYVKEDEDGYVSQVVEKQVVSNKATTGHYFYKKGHDCVKYIDSMIGKNIRHNNEFYFAPSFNEAIGDGKKILTYQIDSSKFWGLGTPEDLEYFTKNYKK